MSQDQFGAPGPVNIKYGPQRDRWDRPKVTNPATGRVEAFTRVTTLASTLDDTWNLSRWSQRMVAKGIALRPDLLAMATALPLAEKAELDRVTKAAAEHAGSTAGANWGSATHLVTEEVDAGRMRIDDVPPLFRDTVLAYRAAVDSAGITYRPEWIERFTASPDVMAAGTFDRIGEAHWWTLPRIMDLKSQQSIEYGWLKIAVQLAVYAHGCGLWHPTPGWKSAGRDDFDAGAYDPMPAVDQAVAVVMWAPSQGAACELWEVDIETGWQMARAAVRVRDWRKASGDLARPLVVPAAPAGPIRDVIVVSAEPAPYPHPLTGQTLPVEATDEPTGQPQATLACGWPPVAAPRRRAPRKATGVTAMVEAASAAIFPNGASTITTQPDVIEDPAALVAAARADGAAVTCVNCAEQGHSNCGRAMPVALAGPVTREQQAATAATVLADLREVRAAADDPQHAARMEIIVAGNENDLALIWTRHAGVWTDDLTALGQRRLADLAAGQTVTAPF